MHGEEDQVVPPLWAAHSAGVLANLACDVNLIRCNLYLVTNLYVHLVLIISNIVARYPNVQHEVTTEMKHDLSIFLKKTLG